MTNINITASEREQARRTPAQPSQSPQQQTQQPGDNQNQQQGDAPNKDKPAQQK